MNGVQVVALEEHGIAGRIQNSAAELLQRCEAQVFGTDGVYTPQPVDGQSDRGEGSPGRSRKPPIG